MLKIAALRAAPADRLRPTDEKSRFTGLALIYPLVMKI